LLSNGAIIDTTRNRLLCMSCGATHGVLREPLALNMRQLLTAEEWIDFFDDKGSRHHEEVDLAMLDFPAGYDLVATPPR